MPALLQLILREQDGVGTTPAVCEGVRGHDGLRKHADWNALLHVPRALQQ